VSQKKSFLLASRVLYSFFVYLIFLAHFSLTEKVFMFKIKLFQFCLDYKQKLLWEKRGRKYQEEVFLGEF